MLDCETFIGKARDIYGYRHFVYDAGGSLCELDHPEVLRSLARHTVLLYIRADDTMERELIARQQSHPKPLYYQRKFFNEQLARYMTQHALTGPTDIVPDEFVQWVFPKLIAHRKPAYEQIAHQYGYTVQARDIEAVRDENDFVELVASAMSTG